MGNEQGHEGSVHETADIIDHLMLQTVDNAVNLARLEATQQNILLLVAKLCRRLFEKFPIDKDNGRDESVQSIFNVCEKLGITEITEEGFHGLLSILFTMTKIIKDEEHALAATHIILAYRDLAREHDMKIGSMYKFIIHDAERLYARFYPAKEEKSDATVL